MKCDSSRRNRIGGIILGTLGGVVILFHGESTAGAVVQVGEAGIVKVTPLGTHTGEFCRDDRALVFEDPTGVRILYDPGRTVDETDPRLGDVHVMLLSHAHTDHIGNTRPTASWCVSQTGWLPI